MVRDSMGASLRTLPDLLYRGFTEDEIRTLDSLQKKMLQNLSLPED